MIRLLVYLLILAVLAYGGVLLVQNPGHITVNWLGEVVEAPAALIIGAIALAAIIVWSLFRFVFGLPSFVKVAGRQRRREKGYNALSRGLIAVGSGDSRTAGRAASQANRHLKNDPLAIMLRAQAAHLNGENYVANAAFEELAQREDTRVLGLRGLHAEATRRGDEEAARHFAAAAHKAAPLPWSAKAVLEHRASSGDWEKALATVETSLASRLIDKETGERQRAVLETAIAYDKEMTDPDLALVRARAAIKRAPDLAPAVVVAARLLSRRGDIRKASKIIEKAWPRCQHPEIAEAYLDVRPGDSTQDRLTRAKTLMAIASFDPVSRTTVARAALASKDFETARNAMAPLIGEGKRPTVRQCLLMAELDEAEHGDTGLWREWLARASRAPLDPAWVCDGTVNDHWAPASPTTGRLDAFQWQVPAERLGPAMDGVPVPRRRPDQSLPPAPAAALEHHEVAAVLPLEAPAITTSAAPESQHAAPVSTSAPEPIATAKPIVTAPAPEAVPAGPPPGVQAQQAKPEPPHEAEHHRGPATTDVATPQPARTDTSKGASTTDRPLPPKPAGEALAPAIDAGTPTTRVPAEAKPPLAPTPVRAAQRSDQATNGASSTAPDPSQGAEREPDQQPTRINLPLETAAAERNPAEPRSLFHRRLTPDAEVLAERIAETRVGNGAMPAGESGASASPVTANRLSDGTSEEAPAVGSGGVRSSPIASRTETESFAPDVKASPPEDKLTAVPKSTAAVPEAASAAAVLQTAPTSEPKPTPSRASFAAAPSTSLQAARPDVQRGNAAPSPGVAVPRGETDRKPAPLSRINLPLETVAEERNPGASRSLFHRRLTAEAQAHAERLAAARANGATEAMSAATDRAPSSGGDAPTTAGGAPQKSG